MRAGALTKEAFEKLLGSLDPDRERAAARYEIVRRKLVHFFEWRNSPSPDDQADETLDRAANKLQRGEEIRDLSQYVYGIARMLLLEIGKSRQIERAALDDARIAPAAAGDRRLDCLDRCLDGLGTEARSLILEYYRGDKRAKIDNRKALAHRLDVPLNALRIRALRVRDALEACVEACLVEREPAETFPRFRPVIEKGEDPR